MKSVSFKDMTDEQIKAVFQKALDDIRKSDDQYGRIITEVSGGKVKFITIEKPFS